MLLIILTSSFILCVFSGSTNLTSLCVLSFCTINHSDVTRKKNYLLNIHIFMNINFNLSCWVLCLIILVDTFSDCIWIWLIWTLLLRKSIAHNKGLQSFLLLILLALNMIIQNIKWYVICRIDHKNISGVY